VGTIVMGGWADRCPATALSVALLSSRFGESIRLSSYLANPLSKNQISRRMVTDASGVGRPATASHARHKCPPHPHSGHASGSRHWARWAASVRV